MKLCYVANSRFPSERAHMTQIVHMCNAFVAQGHEVVLLVTDRKTSVTEDPSLFYGVKLNFSVARVSVPDIAGRSPMIPKSLRPYVFMIQRVAFTFLALKYFRKQEFTHLYGRDEWILLCCTYFINIPVIWESHEAKFSLVARKLMKRLEHVVVISEGIRDFYIARGIQRKKILIAHDAVDDRFFAPHVSSLEARKNLNITTKKPVIMYIGGLEAWKGSETLFQASKDQDVFETYVIGGKKEELEIIKKKYPSIHFLGPRPYKDLPLVQQATDILVIPNTAKIPLSAEYTSPLKLFSYMTAKKPIVASRVPSIANVVHSDEVFFYTPDDPQDLQRTILYVLTDQGEARKKVAQIYKKSLHYTWGNRARMILAFLSG